MYGDSFFMRFLCLPILKEALLPTLIMSPPANSNHSNKTRNILDIAIGIEYLRPI